MDDHGRHSVLVAGCEACNSPEAIRSRRAARQGPRPLYLTLDERRYGAPSMGVTNPVQLQRQRDMAIEARRHGRGKPGPVCTSTPLTESEKRALWGDR